ncbi:hypothetical protein J4218_03500 [Candidatus Pacearchaeota archaeon]|nr:hypothetical protein [Candidatus Pacearchaeota archaeon]
MEYKKGYSFENNVIIINRELTELDIFVKDFLEILKKYSDYLVVSGFVSISSGRTRGTEDVDILFPIIDESEFSLLFNELIIKGFWCYQADDFKQAYSYIKGFNSIRFARVGEMFPNIELIPINPSKKAKYFEFTHPQKIKIDGFEFKIPPIEFEILYKEIILAGKKDMEDARHLRTFFSDILNHNKFKEYEKIISGELK